MPGRAWRVLASRRGRRALLLLALGLAVFELGRWAGGYSLTQAIETRIELGRQIAALERDNDALERQQAAAEVGRRVDRESQLESQRLIGELQAENARQQQELQFFRGVLAEQYGTGALKVQEVAVRPAGTGSHVVAITLVQTATRDAIASGTLKLWIGGARHGALTRLPLEEVSPASRSPLSFTLRYFTTLEVPVTLPAGFEPANIELEYRWNRGGPNPERQAFPWREAGSVPF